jgi:ATP-dependent DNA helicase RecQ
MIKDDCGICDVCVARKKSGLSADEFSKIVISIENELKASPLGMEQLNQKLGTKKEDLYTTIDYLLDAGRVGRNEKGELLLA